MKNIEKAIHEKAMEATARQTLKAVTRTNTQNIAIAIILKSIKDWYEKGIIHGRKESQTD